MIKKDTIYQNKGLFITYLGDLFTTYFGPKEPSSGNKYIKVTRRVKNTFNSHSRS